MSEDMNSSATAMADAAGQVNKLLHELEGMVDTDQHATLTEFFAEWAVLSAMRTTLQMQSDNAGETSATETQEGA